MPGKQCDTRDTTVAGQQGRDWPTDDLLAGAAEGEWGAWNEIISRYRRLIIVTATRMGLSYSNAEDVAQLTWLRLWEHGHQIREPDSLAVWLVSTARREAIRVASASNRYVLCADPSTEHAGSCTGAVRDVYPVEQELDWPVEQALGRLPARYRTLLLLLSSDLELSYSEVADCMGLPIGSIGPMRMRAIRMLKEAPEFNSDRFSRPERADIAS